MGFGNGKTKAREIDHIIGLNKLAASFEINYFDMIHPKEDIDIRAFLDSVPQTDWIEENAVELKKNSGVYAITWDDKSFYVGETINTFAKRIKEHREELRAGTHYNKKLQREYDKPLSPGERSRFVKIYFLEYGMCDESCKGMFKLRNLFREFYYQQMFYNSKNYKLLNKEDTLRVIYDWRGLKGGTVEEAFMHRRQQSTIAFYCDGKGKASIPKTYEDIIKHSYSTLQGDGDLYREICQCLRENSEHYHHS